MADKGRRMRRKEYFPTKCHSLVTCWVLVVIVLCLSVTTSESLKLPKKIAKRATPQAATDTSKGGKEKEKSTIAILLVLAVYISGVIETTFVIGVVLSSTLVILVLILVLTCNITKRRKENKPLFPGQIRNNLHHASVTNTNTTKTPAAAGLSTNHSRPKAVQQLQGVGHTVGHTSDQGKQPVYTQRDRRPSAPDMSKVVIIQEPRRHSQQFIVVHDSKSNLANHQNPNIQTVHQKTKTETVAQPDGKNTTPSKQIHDNKNVKQVTNAKTTTEPQRQTKEVTGSNEKMGAKNVHSKTILTVDKSSTPKQDKTALPTQTATTTNINIQNKVATNGNVQNKISKTSPAEGNTENLAKSKRQNKAVDQSLSKTPDAVISTQKNPTTDPGTTKLNPPPRKNRKGVQGSNLNQVAKTPTGQISKQAPQNQNPDSNVKQADGTRGSKSVEQNQAAKTPDAVISTQKNPTTDPGTTKLNPPPRKKRKGVQGSNPNPEAKTPTGQVSKQAPQNQNPDSNVKQADGAQGTKPAEKNQAAKTEKATDTAELENKSNQKQPKEEKPLMNTEKKPGQLESEGKDAKIFSVGDNSEHQTDKQPEFTPAASNNEYTYIDHVQAQKPSENEYATLDQMNEYDHSYELLLKPNGDPKARPRMPLPTEPATDAAGYLLVVPQRDKASTSL